MDEDKNDLLVALERAAQLAQDITLDRSPRLVSISVTVSGLYFHGTLVVDGVRESKASYTVSWLQLQHTRIDLISLAIDKVVTALEN